MRRKKDFNTKYSPEFKLSVIMDMRENHLGYRGTVRKYWNAKSRAEEDNHKHQLKKWERIYLEEGEAGLYIERRGRTTKMDNPKKGRPRKKSLDKEIENDLIAENQRLKERNEYLEMENEYLKKLDALVRAEAQQNGKKRK
jgi:transposase